MKLTDLEARFIQHGEKLETWTEVDRQPGPGERPQDVPTRRVTGMKEHAWPVAMLAEAHGVRFLCPICFAKNGGNIGTHHVEVTFAGRGVPDHLGSHAEDGSASRWEPTGTGLADLTLRPSIWCKSE